MIKQTRFRKNARYISLVGFMILIFTVALKRHADLYRYTGYFFAVVPWGAYVCSLLKRRDWYQIAIQYAALVLMGSLVVLLFSGQPLTEVMSAFFMNIGLYLLFALILFRVFPYTWKRAYQQFPSLFLWIQIAFAFFVIWALMSAFSSPRPTGSFKFFRKELIIYVILFMVLLQSLTIRNLRRILIVGVIAGMIVSLLSIGESLLYYVGSQSVKDWLLNNEIIVIKYYHPLNPYTHSQYPLGHPNRLASYLLIMALLMLVTYTLFENRRAYLLLLGIPLAFLGIIFTMTRGALLALVLGLCVFFLLYKKRALPIMGVLLIFLYFVAPGNIRDRFLSTIQPKTYSAEVDGAIYARMLSINMMFNLIAENPLFGVGYSHFNMKEEYNLYQPERPGKRKLHHAHNNFLQITGEIGILGGLAFLIFILLIGVMLLKKHFSHPPPPSRATTASLLGLYTGIHLFGMTNTSLRYNVGILIWMLFAAMIFYSNHSETLLTEDKTLDEDEFEAL